MQSYCELSLSVTFASMNISELSLNVAISILKLFRDQVRLRTVIGIESIEKHLHPSFKFGSRVLLATYTAILLVCIAA